MITDGQKWHYLTVKNVPALLGGITWNHYGDFSCLNCFDSNSTEKKNLKNIKKYVVIMIIVM